MADRQKYSRYLPVYDLLHGKNARKSSVVSKDNESRSARDSRISRASVESFGKRRSTMNSRGAYDEDEVLRKVLEESKNEVAVSASENGNRKKRSRDDSEEYVLLVFAQTFANKLAIELSRRSSDSEQAPDPQATLRLLNRKMTQISRQPRNKNLAVQQREANVTRSSAKKNASENEQRLQIDAKVAPSAGRQKVWLPDL